MGIQFLIVLQTVLEPGDVVRLKAPTTFSLVPSGTTIMGELVVLLLLGSLGQHSESLSRLFVDTGPAA